MIRLSRGILFFELPGLFLNLGQWGLILLNVVDRKKWEKSFIFLFNDSFFQSVASRDWIMGCQFALWKLNDDNE